MKSINVFRHLIKKKTFKVLLNKIFNKIRSKNSKVDLIWLKTIQFLGRII